MKKILLLILSLGVFTSCTNEEDGRIVNIRLSNVSNFDFTNIIVNTSTGDLNYTDLDSGNVSEYNQFELAYRYAYIEVQIDGERYVFQPTDYVGETPLRKGNYTYQINLTDIQKQYYELDLELIED